MSKSRFLVPAIFIGLLGASFVFLAPAQKTITYVGHYLESFPRPQAYRDPHTGTLLYVETDGRHIAAISSDGKLLWSREPHKDSNVPMYRTENPQIIYIGESSKSLSTSTTPESPDKFVVIRFTNSQFGALRISDGEFLLLGQD